jgi:CubicO group peptidase (beta-lactamase class C family)
MRIRALAWLACLCFTLMTAVSVAAPLDVPRMERAIDLRVSTGQFTGTVLVALDDKILISKGYGLADIAGKISNTPDTKFRLGSVTKQFTAASILLLQERGKLRVEDPVKKYLPDAPAAWDGITIFHLLTHTSGIPNFTSFPDYRSTESIAVTPEQLVARFRDKPLDFPPGSAFSYSNSGYVLLGYLIEKVSGVPYARFVQDNIFAPLHMKSSGYDSSKEKIALHATGYSMGAKGPEVAGYIDMSIPFSAGALYSTTGDVLRWQRALHGGRLLKPDSLRQMTTPFKQGYAFGLFVAPGPDGGQVISHSGGIEGFNTYVAHVTPGKVTVVVLANLNGPAADQIGADLVKVVQGAPGTLISDRVQKAASPETLQRLAGHYLGEGDVVYTLSQKEDHLLSQGAGQSLDLYPETDTEFFARAADLQVRFERDPQGQVTDFVLQSPGRTSTARRISDAEAQQRAEALARKVSEHQATPGSAEAVRRSLEEIAAGTPSYDRMSAELAQAVRTQLPTMQPFLKGQGAIKSIDFKTVGPAGGDVYNVSFEKGLVVGVSIVLSPDGKIQDERMGPPAP